ncbi:hypothetical protein RhiirA1_185492 [Rhizophagus irregularis]|uniref:Uncharacterized protein n=1 Tax=Rhizophagus irregularis TaxID=588596 RepID=A0A2N0RSQ5_9GLOM|nr:hypothetical protein RhiirA1_185492 [Rhizophagus irregularis]GET63752.1 hypothetical protein RIR_jg29400.t1 [Rhizophagus irregularis DAOM 181602=DAOM 197198]
MKKINFIKWNSLILFLYKCPKYIIKINSPSVFLYLSLYDLIYFIIFYRKSGLSISYLFFIMTFITVIRIIISIFVGIICN